MIKCLQNKDLTMIPSLYETDDLAISNKDKIVHLHLYNDEAHWFVVESNGEDTFYGIVVPDVDIDKSEWRDIPITELQSFDQNSAAIKCDQNWTPVKAVSVQLIKDRSNWES